MDQVYSIPDKSEFLLLKIRSEEKYSSQQMAVRLGERYLIEVVSQDDKWFDMGKSSTADGYNNVMVKLFRLKMRVAGARCFALCGCLDKNDDSAFIIGLRAEITPDKDGLLSFFANDVPGFYWNNQGSLEVKITKLL